MYDTMGLPVALPLAIPTPGNLRFRRAVDRLGGVLGRALAARLGEGPAVGGDLLEMLIARRTPNDGEDRLSDAEIEDQLMTALVAAPENTNNTLSWALYLLSHHPEIERRLRAELATVLAGRDPGAGDLPRLPFSSMVLSETLRLYPGAWAFDRRAVADDEVSGIRVPNGALVFVSPYVTHRHPAFFPDPEAFVPDRFAEGALARGSSHAYFPFGLGPRQCIGDRFARMLLEIVLPMLLSRFRFSAAPGLHVDPLPLVTLRPKGGMPLSIQRLEANPRSAEAPAA